MKCTIDTAQLVRAMRPAASVTVKDHTIPILAHVLLEAGEDGLRVTTSDLDIQFTQTVPLASCDTPGALTVDSKRLLALAQASAKGGQMSFEVGKPGEPVTIKSGRSRWKLPTLPREDFPIIVEGDGFCEPVAFAPADLALLLNRVRAAISSEETRYYLCGVFLHCFDVRIAACATNGHQLMRQASAIDWPDDAGDAIIPTKAVGLIVSLCGDAADDAAVALEWSKSKLRCVIGGVTVVSKTIDGQFPDYARVIPGDDDKPVTFDPAALAAAVRRTTLVATERTRAVKIARGADKLTVSVTSVDAGTSCEEVPAGCVEAGEVGMNARYLADMLDALENGDSDVMVTMHGADAGAPHRFERADDAGFVGVCMPMRV